MFQIPMLSGMYAGCHVDYISVIVLCFKIPSFSGVYAGCHVDYISVIVLCFRYPRLVVCTQAVTWITLVLLCFVIDTIV